MTKRELPRVERGDGEADRVGRGGGCGVGVGGKKPTFLAKLRAAHERGPIDITGGLSSEEYVHRLRTP